MTVPRAGLVFVQTTGRTPTGVTVWQDGVELGQIAPSERWQNFRLGVPVQAGPVVIVVQGTGTATVLYELAVTFVAGVVENPAPASFQSGIGVISGWVCDAETVEIVMNEGPPWMAAYGTSRADTAGVCGDTDNGFGLLFNWNLLGDGEHTVITLVDGVELARTRVTVTTLGDGVCARRDGHVCPGRLSGTGRERPPELAGELSRTLSLRTGLHRQPPARPSRVLPPP